MSHLSDTEKIYLNAFLRTFRMTGERLRAIRGEYSDYASAWRRLSAGILTQLKIKPEVAEEIMKAREKIDPEREAERLQKLGVKLIASGDENYPALLAEISSPPAAVYVRGQLLPADEMAIAIVGSRTPTAYGRQVTADFARELALAGLTIVSGLAAGCDGIAHDGALSAGGRTIAVLGHGLEKIYPAQNRRLGEKIIEAGGALVSEYPLDQEI